MEINNQLSTKEKIVNFGIQLIKEKGYKKTSVDDICKITNISKTTFYYHFKSKVDLISHFFIRINQTMNQHMSEIMSASDFVNQLWICNKIYLDYLEKLGPDITKELYIANLRKDAKILAPDDIYLKSVMLVLIEKGQKSGQIQNRTDPWILFQALLTLTNGAVYVWAMKNGDYNLNDQAKKLYLALINSVEKIQSGSIPNSV